MLKPANSCAKFIAAICLIACANTSLAAAETELDLSAHAGKVVILDFWASWCIPCLRSFPWLNSMHEKYSDDGLVIIAINLDNDVAAAQQFLVEHPPKFLIVYDEEKQLARKYDVQAMPSSYLIGRDGTIQSHRLGFKVKRQDEYEAEIVEALQDTGVN